jgi:hypothetical protein
VFKANRHNIHSVSDGHFGSSNSYLQRCLHLSPFWRICSITISCICRLWHPSVHIIY